MQAFWMGVGCWKPSAVTACRGSQSHDSVSKQPTNPSRAGTTSCYVLLPETTGASEASRGRRTPMTSAKASLTTSLTFSLTIGLLLEMTRRHFACVEVF